MILVTLALSTALAGGPGLTQEADPPIARMAELIVDAALPADLTQPEGKTRWDLTGIGIGAVRARSLVDAGGAITLVEAPASADAGPLRRLVYSDPTGGDGAIRWLHPGKYAPGLLLGTRSILGLDEERDGRTDRLRIETEIVGIGWVHLPGGPREALLERALVLRQRADAAGYQAEALIHRWIDPRAGIVAAVWGPPTADGRGRESVGGGSLNLDVAASPQALSRLYENEVLRPILTRLGYGWDRGYVPISELTTQGYVTAGDLVNASTWEFTAGPAARAIAGTTTANNATTINGSGTVFKTELRLRDRVALSSAPGVFATVTAIANDTQITVSPALGNGTSQTILRKRAEIAATSVAVSAAETCNASRCGYTAAGAIMDRLDRYFDDAAALVKTNATRQRVETAGTDVTHYLRAGTQNEGLTGSLGTGESRFCYFGGSRTPVPLWKFGHQDARGYYLQPGDAWVSSPFNCEQNIFNGVCASDTCGLFCQLYLKACPGHAGTQGGTVIKSGVLTVPSGHTFNAILVRTVADFCVYLTSSCGTPTSQVRTVVYLWQVPYLGTVVQLDSVQAAPDDTSFTTVADTNIGFGLFPPRTIQATGATSASVSLSWDPGLDTRRITGYKVYWDTDSGAASAYAFSSATNPGQVSFAGTTATISGLMAGTSYYVTVTSLSTFTDPSSGIVTTYESLLYPTQISGDPAFVYPVEVLAATTGPGCTPTAAVSNLRLQKQGSNIQFSWSPSADPCAVGYRVLGAGAPTPPGGFSTVTDTGLVTSWTGNPAQKFFLVKARGGNGLVGP